MLNKNFKKNCINEDKINQISVHIIKYILEYIFHYGRV